VTGTVDNSVAFSYIDSMKTPTNIEDLNDKKLKEVTDKFEAFFIKQVLDVSLKKDDSLYGKDAGDKIYNSMYNDAISSSMGGHFGFSQMLYDFLKESS
jgi:Rod binding domain-containing protein